MMIGGDSGIGKSTFIKGFLDGQKMVFYIDLKVHNAENAIMKFLENTIARYYRKNKPSLKEVFGALTQLCKRRKDILFVIEDPLTEEGKLEGKNLELVKKVRGLVIDFDVGVVITTSKYLLYTVVSQNKRMKIFEDVYYGMEGIKMGDILESGCLDKYWEEEEDRKYILRRVEGNLDHLVTLMKECSHLTDLKLTKCVVDVATDKVVEKVVESKQLIFMKRKGYECVEDEEDLEIAEFFEEKNLLVGAKLTECDIKGCLDCYRMVKGLYSFGVESIV